MEAKLLRTHEQKSSIFSNGKIAAIALAGSVIFSGCASESDTPVRAETSASTSADAQEIDTSEFLYGDSCSGVDNYYMVDTEKLYRLNNYAAIHYEGDEVDTLSESLGLQVRQFIANGDPNAYFEMNDEQEASIDFSAEKVVKERFGTDPGLDDREYDVTYVTYTDTVKGDDFLSEETDEMKGKRKIWKSDEANFCIADIKVSEK